MSHDDVLTNMLFTYIEKLFEAFINQQDANGKTVKILFLSVLFL